ncbi:MAG: hypothetical protein BMS9Abin29_0075 [Gemmatimonadota bacterium]|nr:MAG: hypothetical protein BMS9Abin29_0075 [Gemmatimonadota bacterium]
MANIKLVWVTTAILLVAATSGSLLQGVPAAMVVTVQGDVQLRIGGGPLEPAAVGSRLSGGDEVVPGAGGAATLIDRTGRTRVITETFTVQTPGGGTETSVLSRTVRVLASAATTDARGNPNRQGMIRPIPGEVTLVAPRNGLKVMSTRPTFTWRSVEGVEGYTLQIRRIGGGFNRYRTGPDTVWTLPDSEEALEPGAEYMWTLAPRPSGRPTREQPFTVIAAEAGETVASDLALLADAGLDPLTDGLFLTAVIYRDADLLYEAEDALSELEAGGAPLSASIYLLRGEILDALGHIDQARMAFDKADEIMR